MELQVQEGIRLAHTIPGRASYYPESMVQVKAYGLFVLFIYIYCSGIHMCQGMLQQYFSNALSTSIRVNEQHLYLVVGYAHEAKDSLRIVTKAGKHYLVEKLLQDQWLKILDVRFPEKMVRCPYRSFPYGNQFWEFRWGNRSDFMDRIVHGNNGCQQQKIVQWGIF